MQDACAQLKKGKFVNRRTNVFTRRRNIEHHHGRGECKSCRNVAQACDSDQKYVGQGHRMSRNDGAEWVQQSDCS
jgi:hypothetical protein